MSNAYQRIARPRTHHHRPAIDAFKKIGVCDLFNRQIKHRIWPHRHGGKGTTGERGKQECILLNTLYAYRDINQIADVEYDYYSFCAQVADDWYTYSNVPL